jgi:hypothetical protein
MQLPGTRMSNNFERERERERALNKIPRIYMTLKIDQSDTILAMVCNKPTIRNKLFSRLRDCLDNFLI